MMEPSDQVGLLDLPDELLLTIVSCRVITVQDLGRGAASCTRLRNVIATQDLWRKKVEQHYPKVWDQLPSNAGIQDWRREVQIMKQLEVDVHKLVSSLSQRLYQHLHLTTPVYAEIDALVSSGTYTPIYIINILRQIVDDGEQYDNMTNKYYALRVMSHVHQGACRREWEEFVARSSADQSLEVGAILMARWFQPHADISIKQMTSVIDDIAEQCRDQLRINHPDHPALCVPLTSPGEVLTESRWSHEKTMQLFKCINHILYYKMKMTGNSEDYYNLKNSLINEVLTSKKGIPISLSIIYMAVCHRLGILLEPVNYPSHFVMKWKIPSVDDYEYVDAFNKGRRLTGRELLKELPLGAGFDQVLLTTCDAMSVFQRMIRNIMNVAQMQAHVSDHMELFCSATELMSLLTPNDRSIQELLLRIYYTLEIHYDRIVAGCHRLLTQGPSTIIEEMLADCERILESQRDVPRPISPNPRYREVAYAIGMVMQHKRYHYTCVIFGWDKECRMPSDWVQRMGVHNLLYKTKQPFYNVLVYDGSHRYAAQENLEIATDPRPITHSDVGKYFKKFNGTHYIPNTELEQEYPEDEPVRNELLRTRGWL
ncbi:F-box only protein 21-like isoform X2 [Penaeus japonicus]|uniref:F-box only protein 21-like isoform X2 n=1 Tax=Penaeus japonicus TaxID=27405 RepID=UPI001C70DEC2|nr:F-box only protein 21-like isoform X2 [Penaeus japonicus]